MRGPRSLRLASGRRLGSGAWLAGLLSLAALAEATAHVRDARGDAAPRAHVGVLILQDPSTDWGRRVQGQLSDLPASAEIRAAPTLAGRTVREPAAPDRALTAWLATGSDPGSNEREGTFIVIWFAGAAKPYTRRIAADWRTLSAGDRSAALELAALSVRSAVRSLLLDPATELAATQPASANPASANHAAGNVTARDEPAAGGAAARPAAPGAAPSRISDAERLLAPPLEAPAAPELGAPGATPAEPSDSVSAASASAPRLGLELGAAWQFYGRTALGAPGLRAGVQLLGGAWGLEVLGQYGWPVAASVGSASFDLQRHAALAELSVVAADLGAWRFCPLLRAGVTWLRRDATRAEPGDIPLQGSRAQSYRSPFVGAGAIAEQRLSAALSLSLRGVLNVETAIPTFTLVDTSGAAVSSGSPWSVQPSIEVGASWR